MGLQAETAWSCTINSNVVYFSVMDYLNIRSQRHNIQRHILHQAIIEHRQRHRIMVVGHQLIKHSEAATDHVLIFALFAQEAVDVVVKLLAQQVVEVVVVLGVVGLQ